MNLIHIVSLMIVKMICSEREQTVRADRCPSEALYR